MRTTIAILIGLLLSAGSYSAHSAQEPLNYRHVGELAMRLIQTGYFLELLSSGSCRPYSLRPHPAKEDTSFVISTLPERLKNDQKVVNAIATDGERLKGYAQREISELNLQLTKGSEELRCGLLLGIGSVTYYQARRDWANYLQLEKPAWVQP